LFGISDFEFVSDFEIRISGFTTPRTVPFYFARISGVCVADGKSVDGVSLETARGLIEGGNGSR
jgi:hypothetical protein